MPNKPEKVGIKSWMLVEVDSKYIINGFPYCRAEADRPTNELQGEFVTKKLMEPYFNKGRHVTTDNIFTSLKLADELLKVKTTLIGTVKHNKRELPECAKFKKHQLHSSKFFENRSGSTLTIYQCKPAKSVVILSSLNESIMIPPNFKKGR